MCTTDTEPNTATKEIAERKTEGTHRKANPSQASKQHFVWIAWGAQIHQTFHRFWESWSTAANNTRVYSVSGKRTLYQGSESDVLPWCAHRIPLNATFFHNKSAVWRFWDALQNHGCQRQSFSCCHLCLHSSVQSWRCCCRGFISNLVVVWPRFRPDQVVSFGQFWWLRGSKNSLQWLNIFSKNFFQWVSRGWISHDSFLECVLR